MDHSESPKAKIREQHRRTYLRNKDYSSRCIMFQPSGINPLKGLRICLQIPRLTQHARPRDMFQISIGQNSQTHRDSMWGPKLPRPSLI